MREENMEMDRDLNIDWSKFKSNAKGKMLEKSKDSYIEFCKMLDKVDFELVSDYIINKDKVELVYKLDSGVRLNVSPDGFKSYTCKAIADFKESLTKNNDKLIKFVGLTIGGNLIAKIKTFDGGMVDLDIASYNSFNKSRQDFYSKIKEVSGYTKDSYVGKNVKMNIFIDEIKLNPMCPVIFKTYTYKRIINFKKQVRKKWRLFYKVCRINKWRKSRSKYQNL